MWGLNESVTGKCLTRVWHWWARVRLHTSQALELLSKRVEKARIKSLDTYLIRFSFLLSDAVNGSWGMWRGEMTSPGSHTWSEAKLGFMWSQPPPEIFPPLLAIAKGWEFSSLSNFCDNLNSHNCTQEGLTIQDFSWAVAPFGQCWAFVQVILSTWKIIACLLAASQFSSALQLCSGALSW